MSANRQIKPIDSAGGRPKTRDPLCIDADKIEKAAAEAGTGLVEHRRFDDLCHDFHLQVVVLAEADEAITDMARGCAPS